MHATHGAGSRISRTRRELHLHRRVECCERWARAADPIESASRALPAVAMAESDAAEIRSLIGEFLLLRAGITAASFSQLRLLGDTEVGPLYFVPGSLGACVVLSTRAASCGDPGASDQSQIVVAARVPDRGIFIGGGVTSRSVRALEAVRADGSRVPVNVVEGRFILNRTHALSTLQEVVGSE